MPSENTAEAATEPKCSNDKGDADADAVPEAGRRMPSVSPSTSSSKSARKQNIQYGLTTKVALSRLHEDIENVLLEHERASRAERYACV